MNDVPRKRFLQWLLSPCKSGTRNKVSQGLLQWILSTWNLESAGKSVERRCATDLIPLSKPDHGSKPPELPDKNQSMHTPAIIELIQLAPLTGRLGGTVNAVTRLAHAA